MHPKFKNTLRSLGLILPLAAVAVAAYIVLEHTQRHFAQIESSHFQRALKELVQLNTDEIERFNALPDGTLLAIHGRAFGAELRRDSDAGIEGEGYQLERKHEVLRKSFSERMDNGNRKWVLDEHWAAVYDGAFPSLRWPKALASRSTFGPIADLPGTPGKPTAMFPDPVAVAQLTELGFRGRQNDCLVKFDDQDKAIERICWRLQLAQEQTFFGAKQGRRLIDWHSDSGKILRTLVDHRIDPRIGWQQAIDLAASSNAQRRSLSAWQDRSLLAKTAMLLLLSLAYLILSFALMNAWTKQSRKFANQWWCGLLLGMAGPALFFLSQGMALQLRWVFAMWLAAPILLWRFGKPTIVNN